MAKITVIYKREKSLAAELGLEMKHWLQQRGVEVYLRRMWPATCRGRKWKICPSRYRRRAWR